MNSSREEVLRRPALEVLPGQGGGVERAPVHGLPVGLEVVLAEDREVGQVHRAIAVEVALLGGGEDRFAAVGELDEIEQLGVVLDPVLRDPAEIPLVAQAGFIEGAPVDRLPVLLEIGIGEDLEVEGVHRPVVVHVALVDDVGAGQRHPGEHEDEREEERTPSAEVLALDVHTGILQHFAGPSP
jgi:hypothetical protein